MEASSTPTPTVTSTCTANDLPPGAQRLLLNDGSFEDDPACFCDLDMFAMGVGVGDANADGLVDLYLTDLAGPTCCSMTVMARSTRGTGDVGVGAECRGPPGGWGTSFVDFARWSKTSRWCSGALPHGDPDGLAAWGTEFEDRIDGLEQRALLHNQGGESFVDVSATVGFEDPSNGRALAVGDLDRDGRPDLVTAGLWFARTWHTEGGCGAA